MNRHNFDQSRVRGYTRLIRWMKVLLPVGALLLIAAVFFIGRGTEESLFSPEELARLGAGMQLENPRFTGVTEDGDPFVVTARRAVPDGPSPVEIGLEAPEGTITLNDGRTLDGRSMSGLMHRQKEELTLTGNVVITTSDGYRGESDELVIDLDRKEAHSTRPVKGSGPNGTLNAGSFRTERRANEASSDLVIYFENGVHLVLIPEEER